MAALGAAISAGAALMVLAWYRASDTVAVDDQVRWASVGLAGAMLVGVAGLVAVAVTHRRLRFRSVESTLEPCLAGMGAAATAGSTHTTEAGPGVALVAAPNMRHFHRPDCPLAAGKAARPATRVDHERAGRQTCAVCAP